MACGHGFARALATTLPIVALTFGSSGCKPVGPAGEVVAIVNGREITNQDLLAEARATGNTRQGSQSLLQEVIARELLAQSAHDQKLDAYPGYPSDLVRLQQSFLAEKALGKVLQPIASPTPAAIAAFEAAHPYSFSRRAKAQVDVVRFETSDDLKSLEGASDLAAVMSRLKALNTPFDHKTQALDTAQLSDALAAQVVAAPLGRMQFIRQGNAVLAIVVAARDPTAPPVEQQGSMASGMMVKAAAQNQLATEVAKLRAHAKIVYQRGYAPPTAPIVSLKG